MCSHVPSKEKKRTKKGQKKRTKKRTKKGQKIKNSGQQQKQGDCKIKEQFQDSM